MSKDKDVFAEALRQEDYENEKKLGVGRCLASPEEQCFFMIDRQGSYQRCHFGGWAGTRYGRPCCIPHARQIDAGEPRASEQEQARRRRKAGLE